MTLLVGAILSFISTLFTVLFCILATSGKREGSIWFILTVGLSVSMALLLLHIYR